MIVLLAIAIFGGVGIAVALWPLGWWVALGGASVGASLLTAVLALAFAGIRALRRRRSRSRETDRLDVAEDYAMRRESDRAA
jgi:hypothetical protein